MTSCFQNSLKLCFWNIHGVKNKLLKNEILNLLIDVDILILTETHFGKRSKSPRGFCLIKRSEPLDSVKPRGGVAIYKKFEKNIETRTLKINLPDCVVISLTNTKIIINNTNTKK